MDDSQIRLDDMVDNSRLEEIIKSMDEGRADPEKTREFAEVFKQSQLFMPVMMSADFFEGIEDAKEGDIYTTGENSGFDINYLKLDNGQRAVPLFTSSELMESTGLKSSAIALFMSDLADMLEQAPEGRYVMIAINPYTDLTVDMPMKSFLNLFREPSDELSDSISKLLELLKKHSIELEENSTLFLRLDENLLVENAVDGIFTPHAPIFVSSNPKYAEDKKYTNLLLMPKSKKILPIGASENDLDVVIAPLTEFSLQDRLDEFTSLWMCEAQPFYDEKSSDEE
ncbi:SseB family protein [Methanobrevibacter sp.]|uniref:SseB family protein n=1 Tax=Methanobrevibacter sp. TaxID=66852 RepID=UPI0038908D7E